MGLLQAAELGPHCGARTVALIYSLLRSSTHKKSNHHTYMIIAYSHSSYIDILLSLFVFGHIRYAYTMRVSFPSHRISLDLD